MASIFEVFPRKIVAMVAVPFVLGLLLLALLFRLNSTAWVLIILFVLTVLGIIVLFVGRLLAVEKESEAISDGE